MSDGLADVIVPAVSFRQLFMRFALLIFILVFLAENQEFGQVFDGRSHITLLLANQTDFLIALGFLVNVICLL